MMMIMVWKHPEKQRSSWKHCLCERLNMCWCVWPRDTQLSATGSLFCRKGCVVCEGGPACTDVWCSTTNRLWGGHNHPMPNTQSWKATPFWKTYTLGKPPSGSKSTHSILISIQSFSNTHTRTRTHTHTHGVKLTEGSLTKGNPDRKYKAYSTTAQKSRRNDEINTIRATQHQVSMTLHFCNTPVGIWNHVEDGTKQCCPRQVTEMCLVESRV